MSWLSKGLKSVSDLGTQLIQGYSGKSAERSVQESNAANLQVAREQMAFSADQAVKANEFSAKQAQAQRDYETEMSNTSYQRATADMKAAGINPMLAIDQGGAGTPNVSAPVGKEGSSAGATIVPVPPRAVTMISNSKDLIATYLGIKEALAKIDKLKTEVPNIKAATDKTKSERNLVDISVQDKGMDVTRKERALRWENKHPSASGLADALEHRLGLINSALSLFGRGSRMILDSGR